ncbi:MAG: L-2-hydroxyglutarate oxidase [Pseudomonadota bacterium]
MPIKTDIAIIGGGIVGLATAYALSKSSHKSVVVLEKENQVAAHQTGNNSGVIHSGLYYKPGSLKAQNCAQGRQALYEFCQEYNISHERCGKVIVATKEDELPRLEQLRQRGEANGLKGISLLTAEQIKEHEPHAAGLAGLLVPDTGIVDFIEVTKKMAKLVQQKNGTVFTKAKVHKIINRKEGLFLETSGAEIQTDFLINCAGLQSDRVARMCGVDPEMRIVPFRGEYYKLIPERQYLIKNLIYPVPDPQFPFLGVHFTRMIAGGVEAGPNAVFAFKREGYHKTSISVKDLLESIAYPGFWKMSLKHWQMGVGEFYRSFCKFAFVKALQRLLPEITTKDVHTGGAGVRAQAIDNTGFLIDDFCIKQAPRMIHVLNAPSPAATACISIGEKIAEMAKQSWEI